VPGIQACWVFPGELELDVGVEDDLAGGAARVSLPSGQQLIEVSVIAHQAAAALSTACPAPAMLERRVRLASNRFL
jgi:hypothetical protein